MLDPLRQIRATGLNHEKTQRGTAATEAQIAEEMATKTTKMRKKTVIDFVTSAPFVAKFDRRNGRNYEGKIQNSSNAA